MTKYELKAYAEIAARKYLGTFDRMPISWFTVNYYLKSEINMRGEITAKAYTKVYCNNDVTFDKIVCDMVEYFEKKYENLRDVEFIIDPCDAVLYKCRSGEHCIWDPKTINSLGVNCTEPFNGYSGKDVIIRGIKLNNEVEVEVNA